MYDISQKYGIKLKYLYLKNRMEEGQEPKEGQVLYLQNKKPRRER
jgi:hemagglutinin